MDRILALQGLALFDELEPIDGTNATAIRTRA